MPSALHVLLVEDSAHDLALAQVVFDLHDQVRLTTRATAEDALTFLHTTTDPLPDVILMDHHLPGMDGLSALKSLKAHPRLAPVPVVLMSGLAHREHVQQAYAHRASAVLLKDARFVQQLTAFVGFWQQARVPRHTRIPVNA